MAGGAFEYSVRTRERIALVNVTDRLVEAVKESGVSTGVACVHVPHTTCALIVNEDETDAFHGRLPSARIKSQDVNEPQRTGTGAGCRRS